MRKAASNSRPITRQDMRKVRGVRSRPSFDEREADDAAIAEAVREAGMGDGPVGRVDHRLHLRRNLRARRLARAMDRECPTCRWTTATRLQPTRGLERGRLCGDRVRLEQRRRVAGAIDVDVRLIERGRVGMCHATLVNLVPHARVRASADAGADVFRAGERAHPARSSWRRRRGRWRGRPKRSSGSVRCSGR